MARRRQNLGIRAIFTLVSIARSFARAPRDSRNRGSFPPPNNHWPRASPPSAGIFRLPCRKDWLWLAKRALLSCPGRSSRGERLKGKEALPTPLPRGEWRGRGGGGGCR